VNILGSARRSRPEVFDIVTHVLTRDPLLKGNWVELPSGLGLKATWNLLWTWSRPRIDYDHLLSWQCVNHYPRARNLTRKDCLARNVGRLRNLTKGTRFEGYFDVCPATFLLPQDYAKLVAAFRARAAVEARNLWIMKPTGSSRGRGISVVARLDDVTYAEPVVVQAYVPRPLLLGGHKFDLRLYVLVTSFAPLEAFIHGEGFARVATRPFACTEENASDKFVHLTNASIQKHGGQEKGELYGPLRGARPHEAAGTKCSLEFLWRALARADPSFDVEHVLETIRALVLKSLVCVEDQVPHQASAFELFGYDVILDESLQPWLLEVNASPSMAREHPLDASVKERVIRDVVRLVSPTPFDRDALVDVFDRRLASSSAEPGEGLLSRSSSRKRLEQLAPPDVDGLARDLGNVLPGPAPRRVGCPPAEPGGFLRLAPSGLHDEIRRVKRAVCKGGGDG